MALPPQGLPRRAFGAARRRLATARAAGTHALAEVRTAQRAERLAWLRRLALADPGRALAEIARPRNRRGLTPRFLAEARALLLARSQGFPAAAAAFAALHGPRPAEPGPSAFALLRPDLPPPELKLAAPRNRRRCLAGHPGNHPGNHPAIEPPIDLPIDLPIGAGGAAVVLYTACFGSCADPAPLLQARAGVRALLLTDRERSVAGWETVLLPDPVPDLVADPPRATLYAALLGEALLADLVPGVVASLWLDPGLRVVGNLATLLDRWLLPQTFACWRHGAARDWVEVVETALTGIAPPALSSALSPAPARPGDPRPDPGPLLDLAAAAAAAGLPRGMGAVDSRAIWRRHGDPALAALMAAWWERAAPAPETADAVLAVLLAEGAGPRPQILPPAPAAAPDGVFLAAAPWPRPKRRADPAPGRRLPVAFVYDEAFAGSASTFLRAGQLAELVAEELPGHYDIAWTSEVAEVRDSLVILTKWALQTREPEEIARIRARNIAVVGVWDDLIPDPGRMAAIDASMSLSYAQTLELARSWPGTPAFYVPHHVNRLIRPSRPPLDRLRTGYFGELANTVRPASLAGLVELVGINTSRREESWIDRLPEFNAHWIIRQRRDIDGAKPFLKGFLAARLGAVVVTAREDDDALLYLGDDYPFFVRSLETCDLEAMMLAMVEGFGGPDWRLAQSIMAEVATRSSDAVVAAEFRAMVDTITG